MLKIAVILVLVCVLFRWALGKWPWDFAKGPTTRSQAIFKARKLLGVRENATHDEISAAHKRLIAMVHPDKGGTNAQVHEANAARDLLYDELPDPVSGPSSGSGSGDEGPPRD
ncbi:MAG: DnaJ domain-containing protein [Pseudomonadota bacterium]